MDAWNPSQYDRFKNERAQPFYDLAAMIMYGGVKRLLDVGCGTGALTAEIHARAKIPYTLGIDSSAKMLAQTPVLPGLEFRRVSAEEFAPTEKFDAVLSNAALQWADDHARLFPRIPSWLNPGGQFAVQMPVNFDHVSHRLADEVALRYGFKPRQVPVLSMEDYARLLKNVKDLSISTRLYLHPMPESAGVVEWVKGTYLTHFEKQTEPARFQDFLNDYARELKGALPSGPYLYTYRRLFICGRI